MFFNNEKYNTILISILWGLGISVLFRKICKGKNCVVIQTPSNFNMINKVIKKPNGKCYKLVKYNDTCFK